MQWSRTDIVTSEGHTTGIAPLVVSASRATDIPAFHAAWFMERLREGHCVWQNPFNSGQRRYVSFAQCAVFVFWSKNPLPLFPFLTEIEDRGFQYYFQFTLNDYVREGLEPGLPPLSQRLETFMRLAERVGRHRVVWRFDPIILGGTLTVDSVLARMARLAGQLSPYTEKWVFSFVDWYAKTRRALAKVDLRLRPPTEAEMYALAQGIAALNRELPAPLHVATCAEKLTLLPLGIAHNRCVDPALLLRLCPHNNKILQAYGQGVPAPLLLPGCASSKDAGQGGSSLKDAGQGGPFLKDAGQRAQCGCAPSKDIGWYNSCAHQCAYCYANRR